MPLDAQSSAKKKGDKQGSKNHPKLGDVEKQERKTGGHKINIKDKDKE